MVVHGLAPGATLTFLLRSYDEASNYSPYSNVLTASVSDSSSAPTVSIQNVFVDSIGAGLALVSWETVPGAFGFVRWGTTAAYGSATSPEADTVRVHAHWLGGLGAGSTIHYQVVSYVEGARDSTSDATFTVPAEVPGGEGPECPLGLLAVSGVEFVDLTWDASAEADLAGYRGYWSAHERDGSPLYLTEDFEEAAVGTDPAGWVEEGGASTNAFTVASVAGHGKVYRGSSTGYDERVRYLPATVPSWADLEVTGTVRIDAGAGASFIVRAIAGGKGYRFSYDATSTLRIESVGGGELTGDQELVIPRDPDVWYRFRIEAWERPEGVLLRATLWPEGEAEPSRPTLTALDIAPTSLPSGSIALLSTGSGSTWFDDFRVEERPASERVVDRGLSLAWHHGGLSADSSYHYWLEAYDEAGTASLAAGPVAGLPISSGVPSDSVAPAPIADLVAVPGPTLGQARLTWTAVGDDSLEGQAASYDVRWNLAVITSGNWGSSTRLTTAAPLPAGSAEDRLFAGLPQGKTVHFAIRTRDEAGNESSLSNDAAAELPGDGTPPVLSNIRAQSVGTTSAQIAWSADEPCTGEVRHGRTTAYELGSVSETTLLTTHLLTLSGLSPATLYHYQVRSSDAAGNLTVSGDYTFTTQTPAQPQDPVISSLALASLSDTDAVITFVTDVATLGGIDYGPDAGYGTTVSETGYATAHSLHLYPLEPGSTYHFRARATSTAGRTATTPDQTLTTSEDMSGPVISAVEVHGAGTSAASVVWMTDEAAVGSVEYGLSESYGQASAAETTYLYEHERTLRGLASGALFHFRIRAFDLRGNESLSSDFTFATLDSADHQAPLVTEVSVDSVGTGCAYITWETDEASDAQVEYGTGLPYTHATPLDDSLAFSHLVAVCGLSPETVYHFRVLSRDSEGNLAASGDALFETAAPPAPPAPVISLVRAEDASASGITIAWRTDVPALGQVEYGPSASFGTFTAPESSPRLEHQVRIEGLGAGVLFHYRVLSWQTGGPVAVSPSGTFLLDIGTDSDAPYVETVTLLAVGETAADVEWTSDEPTEGRLEYGTTTAYDRLTPLDTNLETTHAVRIGGLLPSTTYHFRVVCSDEANNFGLSPDHSFTTVGIVDSIGPVVDGLTVQQIDGSAVRAAWSTDEATKGRLAYGLDSSLSLSTTWTAAYAVLHQTDVEGLAPGNRFYFQAVGMDGAGNEGRSPIVSLLLGAASDTLPPVVAGEIQVRPGVRDAVLTWSTDEPSNARVDYGLDTTYGGSRQEASFLISHSVTLTGLHPETLYHFRIRSSDAVGNVSVRKGMTFTTLEDTLSPAPRVLSSTIETLTSSLAIVEWITDRPAIGHVEYGEGGSLNRATPLSTVFRTAHSDTVEPLEASTLFSFRIRGLSPEGYFFATAIDTFRTPEDFSPPPPPSFHPAVEVEGGIRLSWEPDPLEEPHTVVLHRRFLPGGDWETVWVATGSDTLYIDMLPANLAGVTKAEYYLEAFDAWGNSSLGETIEVELSAVGPPPVAAFRLLPNRPNPFNPTTVIPFELPSSPATSYFVRIAIYNVAGEEVRLLLHETLPAGTKGEATWDGLDYRGNHVSSGLYYYRFEAGSYAETRRMTLIR